jgi:hypothetical protein
MIIILNEVSNEKHEKEKNFLTKHVRCLFANSGELIMLSKVIHIETPFGADHNTLLWKQLF